MSIIKIGYFWYDTEDRKKVSQLDGKWMYDDPSLLKYLDLSQSEFEDARAGLWGMCFSPTNFSTEFWGDYPSRFVTVSKPK